MISYFKKFSKRRIISYTCLFFFLLVFALFYFFSNPKPTFKEITNRLFLEDITTDTLSLHYTLAYPSHFSIDSYSLTLPRYDKDTIQQSYSKIENSSLALSNIDISTLSEEEAYSYRLLKDYFSRQKQGFPFLYFQENFSPSSGIVVNYPLLMAEYTFRNEKDITDYLTLLADTPNYFDSFFQFQKERFEKGYSQATVSLNEITEQCDTIITQKALNENSHFLQVTFDERLAPFVEDNLISKEKADFYQNKNTEILNHILLPAYENLKNNLLSLHSEEIPLAGLYKKENGKEYYRWLVQKQIGCSLSIPEILRKLESDFEKNLYEFRNLQEKVASYPNYENYILEPFPLSDRSKILKKLQQFSREAFPSLSDFSEQTLYAVIKSVSTCMEEYTSPAFYLIPPIDDFRRNTIYINNRTTPEGLDLFTTLAHEGYPGHLYQTVYYQLYSNKNEIPLIRHIMNYGGYVEGWAIYSEFYSYDYATKLYPEELQDFYSLWHKLLVCDKKLQLAILSILDIKLHYYDDSMETAKDILSLYGIEGEETITEIYRYVLEEPGNYLKYYMGYLLLMDIKEKAEILMDSAFSDIKFHEFILNAGPSDFENLEKRLVKKYSSPENNQISIHLPPT